MDIPHLDLETQCEWCEGRGVFFEGCEKMDCHRCHGCGFVPTEMGARILRLIRHNTRISAELRVVSGS